MKNIQHYWSESLLLLVSIASKAQDQACSKTGNLYPVVYRSLLPDVFREFPHTRLSGQNFAKAPWQAYTRDVSCRDLAPNLIPN